MRIVRRYKQCHLENDNPYCQDNKRSLSPELIAINLKSFIDFAGTRRTVLVLPAAQGREFGVVRKTYQ